MYYVAVSKTGESDVQVKIKWEGKDNCRLFEGGLFDIHHGFYFSVQKKKKLRDQLLYLHNQIISVLTSAQLTRIFEQRVNFDLRRLLGGMY